MHQSEQREPGRFAVIRGAIAALAVTAVLTGSARAGEIAFRSGVVETTKKVPGEVAVELALLAERGPAERHLLVEFTRPLRDADRRSLEARGLTVLRPLGGTAYFAALAPGADDVEALAATGLIADLGAIQPGWKLHPHFLERGIPTWAIVESGAKADENPADDDDDDDVEAARVPDINPTVAVYVLFHPDVALAPDAFFHVALHGGKVVNDLRSVNGLVVEIPYLMIEPLAATDVVQYIEPALPKFSELNNSNRARVGADTAQAAPYSLDGSGVTVMVYDGGEALASHSDFSGRLTVRDTSGLSDHSTHVAGTIGGDGTGNPLYTGMAPGVTLESYGFEQEGGLVQGFLYSDPGDLEDDYTAAINTHGCVISNNSIGTNTAPNGFPCDWEGDYGVTSALIDAIVGGSVGAPIRIVWANGNERTTSVCYGSDTWPDAYHSTAPPACAKNHITVGALNSNDDSMTSFSSWGPADDGRLKPDISAPGCQSDDDFDVTSCSSSGGYTGKCGTSMAAPTVTGISALLLQDYRLQFPSLPDFMPSTLKVLLAHTATDVGNVGPDYQFGYGSVRVVDAIDHMRTGQFVEADVAQGATYSILVAVNPTDTELKVTLAWTDVPGTPNVDPALVNDLDLQVFEPGGPQHFPWTLNIVTPSAPAVRTVADHLNNIEQVVIDAPAPGVYRVDVVGFNVPQGPQSFSVTASPSLINCSSAGVIALDRVKYSCESTATIRVVDCDLNTDDLLIETVSVTIASDTESGGESVLLTETAAETAAFEATIPLSLTDGPGVLQVADGDLVTAAYTDADDGQGGNGVIVTADASVDCVAPGVLAIAATDVQPRSATIQIDTDELVQATVHYGTVCGSPAGSSGSAAFKVDHVIGLGGLEDDTTYFYTVDLVDQAGNAITADNAGACYSFTTPAVPDFFTEEFPGGFDLDGLSVTFIPEATLDGYRTCVEPITALPSDPGTGATLGLSDDGNQLIVVGGGEDVELYGVAYTQLYVNSNGNLSFDSGDGDYTESLIDHFERPRISVAFDDFNPSSGGTVSWEQLADRMVVSWVGVPEFSTSNSNTFQAELFFDGTIRLSYSGMASSDSIVGLSAGSGVSPDFFEMDLSAGPSCALPGDVNDDGVVDVTDLLDVLAAWGPCAGCPEDTDDDGTVDVTDLLFVLAQWTPPAPPASATAAAPSSGAGSGGGSDDAALADAAAASRRGHVRIVEPVRAFINDGELAPADHGGVFDVDRNYRQTDRGVLLVEASGPDPVDDHDVLVVDGEARLGGGLALRFAAGFEPVPGDRFFVVAADSVVGEFAEVSVTADGGPVHFRVAYGKHTVGIHVVAADDASAGPVLIVPTLVMPTRRDAAATPTIDDVRALLRHWGLSTRTADLDGDGTVDGTDLRRLLEGM